MNRSVLFSFLLFLILVSCTPTVSEKGRSIQERIISEMSVIPPDTEIPAKEKEEVPVHSKKHLVRVGILDEESQIMFSFDGLYSIHSKGRQIFKKKKAQGSWRILPQDNRLIFENIDSGESITVLDELIFIPEQISSYVTIGKIVSGKGWHWQNTKSRSYKGSIEFINIGGKITVVNEVGIEQYVYGVVPSEMPSSAPMEALKAQAVLARTNVFSKVGAKYKGKPYSLSSDVYSQVYTGIDHMNERTNKAVDETRGMILTYRNKPVEALFHSVCGGYLEGNDVIWGTNRLDYLQPKPCTENSNFSYGDLSEETNFVKWIDSRPDNYCNLDRKAVSVNLDYAKKYFRWEVRYKRSELEKIISSSTKTDIGMIKDIRILGRGESGKAKSVQVTGSKNSVTINRELNIRRRLSRPPLYSANFYILKLNTDRNGYADTFVFKGAGFGHGTGMCQIGAAGMGSTGKNFLEILEFYFEGTMISKLDE